MLGKLLRLFRQPSTPPVKQDKYDATTTLLTALFVGAAFFISAVLLFIGHQL